MLIQWLRLQTRTASPLALAPALQVMASQSATHRVLDIPELLDLVFRLLDHKSNLNNACVSHNWTEIGLNNLWRSVDSSSQIIHLFSKLAPLKYELAIGNVRTPCMISRIVLLTCDAVFHPSNHASGLGELRSVCSACTVTHVFASSREGKRSTTPLCLRRDI